MSGGMEAVSALHRARQTHRDALEALDLPAHAKASLIAAAEALAKARSVADLHEHIGQCCGGNAKLSPN